MGSSVASNNPAGDKGIFPPCVLGLREMQPLIARRLKWQTRLPAEVSDSDRSDAVAMVTLVSWETPKGCHGIPSPIPLGPRSSHKKTFPDGSSPVIPQDTAARPCNVTPSQHSIPRPWPRCGFPLLNKAPIGNKHTPDPSLPAEELTPWH